jgi:ABC transporter DrrB family efflux protein
MSRLRGGFARVAVLFPPELDEELLADRPAPIQVLIDGSDANVAEQARAAAIGLGIDRSLRRLGLDAASGVGRFDVRPRLLYNPDGRSESFFVPGLAGIILQLVTMVLTAFAVVRERERGTMEQLLVTPVAPLALTLGKILPAVLTGAGETVLVVLAMVHVFDVRIAGSVPLLAGVTILFLFTSLALGLLISTLARTQMQALMMTMLLIMPAVLLSGFMFPRSGMPTPIYELTFAIPTTYFIEILRGIVLRGATAAELAHWIWPLAGIGLLLALLAALRLRKRAA